MSAEYTFPAHSVFILLFFLVFWKVSPLFATQLLQYTFNGSDTTTKKNSQLLSTLYFMILSVRLLWPISSTYDNMPCVEKWTNGQKQIFLYHLSVSRASCTIVKLYLVFYLEKIIIQYSGRSIMWTGSQ